MAANRCIRRACRCGERFCRAGIGRGGRSGWIALPGVAFLKTGTALSALGDSFGVFLLLFGFRILWWQGSGYRPELRARIRFVVVSALWLALFAFGAAVVIGLGSGLAFGYIAAHGGNPAADQKLMATVGFIWAVSPLPPCAGDVPLRRQPPAGYTVALLRLD